MRGGTGDDTYTVDNTGDTVTESASAGTDTVNSSVTYILSTDVENLTLTGSAGINATGNGLNNTLVGNSGANLLNGLSGADIMRGGTGDDTYTVDNTGDTVTESALAGTDTVNSSVNYILTANVENLTLTGSAGINATGNVLDNIIYANAGNNILDGLGGNDTLSYFYTSATMNSGGVPGSTPTVSSAGVMVDLSITGVQDTGHSGVDTIRNFENLIGSNYDDTLSGNSVANRLNGGLGNDTLTGGSGRDAFIFDTALNATTNKDIIIDFVGADDTIQLNHAIFANLTVGTLSAANFSADGIAHDSNDYILYNHHTGILSYDADGNGAGATIAFAQIGENLHLGLTNANLVVI